MRGPELPFNAYTHQPGPMEDEKEIDAQYVKRELLKITKEYIEENKETERINLSKEQQKGLRSLKKRQKEGEIVIFQTDKSGKMSVDTPQNYAEAAKTHIEKDKIIDQAEYNK